MYGQYRLRGRSRTPRRRVAPPHRPDRRTQGWPDLRSKTETRVLSGPNAKLPTPELIDELIASFNAEAVTIISPATTQNRRRRSRQAMCERARFHPVFPSMVPRPISIHPSLVKLYQRKVRRLEVALHAEGTEQSSKIGRQLCPIKRLGKKVWITVPGSEVKNSVDHDYEIPAESVVLLDFYVAHCLPLFGPNPQRWLFPGDRPDRPKSYDQFSRQFSKVILERTGLHVYPHLTRHLAALLYLGENPGAFEAVRRVLGHKSMGTTMKSYASFDDGRVLREFDELVLRIRDTIAKQVKDG